ncbi:hypothetical protein [Vampirovibrio sp.]|uniref:hypothetical protein n=1 Tax=Vampirovibrio sp. TaxID=2717857 RepID=UPI003593712F
MAISSISSNIAREVFHTSLAGVAAKGVGSSFRVWDDRNAPSPIQKNTIKREAATLAMVSAFTAGIDLAGQKITQKAAQIPALKTTLEKAAHHRILIKAVPVSLGILMAELLSRKLAPRNIWSEDGQLNESVLDSDSDSDDEDIDALDKADHKAPDTSAEQPSGTRNKKTAHAHVHPKPLPLTFAQAGASQQYAPFPSFMPFPASSLSNPFQQMAFTRLPSFTGL